MAEPELTIITPHLNYGRYLGDCLASTALQSIGHYEHLVIDGGSTDDSAEITALFPSAHWLPCPGSNQSEALNEGFRRARGRVVCWLNSDDVLMPGAARKAIAAIDAAGDRVNVTSNYLFVNEDLQLVRRQDLPAFSPWIYRNWQVYLPTSGSFLTNTVAGDEILVDKRYEIAMDQDFHLKLSEHGYEFVHLADYLGAMRIHEQQKSGVGNKLRGKADPLKERAKDEKARLSSRYGGIFVGDRRLLPHIKPFAWIARAQLVAQIRLRHLRTRLDTPSADRTVRSWTDAWRHSLRAHVEALRAA